MENRAEFLNKLNELVKVAKEKGNTIEIDEVKAFFEEGVLTEEQFELVFDYLLAQKVVVKGYFKMPEEEVKETVTYSEEEKIYLEEYCNDLKAFKNAKEGEREELFAKLLQGDLTVKNRLTEIYLKEVVEVAKEMYTEEIFLGDLIQEGNVGLILGLDMLTDLESAHQVILGQVRQSMQMLIEESTELSQRDKKMVEKVTMLDEGIKTLTEELGRKVTIDELAVHMGMTEEEIEDVLRLMGEDTEEEEQDEADK